MRDYGVLGGGQLPWGLASGLTPSGRVIITAPIQREDGGYDLKQHILSADGSEDTYTMSNEQGNAFTTPGGEQATFHYYTSVDLGHGEHVYPWHGNRSGMEVGNYSGTAPDYNPAAFLWDGETLHDLSSTGGPGTRLDWAAGINAAGDIVGGGTFRDQAGSGNARQSGFLLHDGIVTELPFREANDVNDLGQVVGSSGDHAFLYENGQAFDLNDLIPPEVSWTLQSAIAINNAGQILVVANGNNFNGRVLVLTSTEGVPTLEPLPDDSLPPPIDPGDQPSTDPSPGPLDPDPTPVPEPTTVAVLAIGLGGFWWHRRVRRAPR